MFIKNIVRAYTAPQATKRENMESNSTSYPGIGPPVGYHLYIILKETA